MGEMKRRPSRRLTSLLLLGTALSGLATSVAVAQEISATNPAPTNNLPNTSGIVRGITVRGNERLEPETVRSYTGLAIGDSYDRERLDRALKDLYATELFADVTIRDDNGVLIIEVRENPVINRIVLEGNKRLKEDKIREEIRLAPRQIFTRSKARADVARIMELYRRSGRFAANVEPKIVQLDQNRVDVVFEIDEGPKSKVRQINIIGNERFSDGDLRDQMATKVAKWWKIFQSNDTYDPDRMAYDQQKLRQFYLTQGYADFRVVSATAELTPDRRDFIITYVVEEGERYKFGDVSLESEIRDIKPEQFKGFLQVKKGDWYNAQKVEDTVNTLTETAGLFGYAFADVRPQFNRDKDKREMNVTFVINEAPRVYVERIDINGNVRTRDKVIRREFRLAEGDAFNSFKVKRSRDRIQSLGFFQDNLEIQQKPGSTPDKVVLEVDVEERSTGELQVSAGFSSLEKFILNLSVRERNFLGRGQELRAGVNYSSYSKSIELGFTEPYFLGRNLALGGDIFYRDYDSLGSSRDVNRNISYQQSSYGFQIRTGFPVTEYWAASLRYGLSFDDVTLGSAYFLPGTNTCDPFVAGLYICDSLGKSTTSSIGYTIAFDNLNNRLRPTAGQRFVFNQDVAGLGGDKKYVRSRVNYDKYWGIGGTGFVLNAGAEAGYIFGWGGDNIRVNDRFFLGEPRMRGFDIRGVGPRSLRAPFVGTPPAPSTDPDKIYNDALGGNAYYLGRLELEIPLGSSGKELGIRPSIFTDVGALWDTGPDRPPRILVSGTGTSQVRFEERVVGDSWKPRVSVGVGVSWNSPFGPFRIDVAKALVKEEGDDTKLFQFNVGTQF